VDNRRIAEFATGNCELRKRFPMLQIMIWDAQTNARAEIQGPPNLGSWFVRPAIAGPGSREPSRVASRPCGFDPRARADHAHRGRNEKSVLCPAATCTKVRPYLTLPRYRTAARTLHIPWERSRFAPGLRPGSAFVIGGIQKLLDFPAAIRAGSGSGGPADRGPRSIRRTSRSR
jgi:hypothetical protein